MQSEVAIDERRVAKLTWNRDIHVITIALAYQVCADDALDRYERFRAAELISRRDRGRFISAHTATRTVLGHCLGIPAPSVRYVFGKYGKPVVANAEANVRFSLSHTDDLALLALSNGPEVGVDVERHECIDVSALAAEAFSASEYEALKQMDEGDQTEAFYRCWTLKESFVKAKGEGMSLPFDTFDVTLTKQSSALLACRTNPEDVEKWRCITLPIRAGYSAAVTIEEPVGSVLMWPGVEAFIEGRCEVAIRIELAEITNSGNAAAST